MIMRWQRTWCSKCGYPSDARVLAAQQLGGHQTLSHLVVPGKLLVVTVAACCAIKRCRSFLCTGRRSHIGLVLHSTSQLIEQRHAGMMCGGCVGSVKRILEGHNSVTSASVNLATETALVRVLYSQDHSSNGSVKGAEASNGSSGGAVQQLGGDLAQVWHHIARCQCNDCCKVQRR